MAHKRMVVAVLGSILLVGALVAVLVLSGSDDVRPADSAAGTQGTGDVADYLAGEGKLVIAFRTLSSDLVTLDEVTGAERKAVCIHAAAALDAAVDPTELYEVAARIPDAALAEIAVDERAARSTLLIACGKDDDAATDQALAEVKALDEAFRLKLVEE